MFEMPWYVWLNLFGLVILWVFYWINHALQNTGGFWRATNYSGVVIAAYFIVTHGTIGLPQQPTYFLLACAIFLFVMTAWELAAATYLTLFSVEEKLEEALSEPAQANRISLVAASEDDTLDLDEGTVHSSERQAEIADALRNLVGPGSTGADRVRGLSTLLSVGDDECDEDDEDDLIFGIIGIAFVGVVLLPACWVALRLF